ncbi:PilN domain-containing protein [Ralstonia insidiosa]|jgi:type IV pilus assembly protein PilN|uniref:PilN domain-containing protein n=1 Tax=Ralstonia TaxID=48736 RepID=UPI000664C092|nr:PilN domain-containing protein [Ralstonia insidiosa]KMW44961.1 ferrous iron transporter B [Ralstonia sp. MD27]MBX3774034.1 PilN domain-containing protein [Ralstonia pickettii]NOZ19394.1 PilN domain-containing protein [Betaproteobacteria bacterium]MBA9857869.1 ferrous iron transporter B [Ralstonia insidiosa]MBA9871605.1 ferrous iron transporter B [Ralstonia insidiosa]
MANESVNALPSVNLLPYHAERRADKRKKVFMSLGAAAAAGAVMVFLGGMVIDHQTEEAQRINGVLTQKNAEMDKQIVEVNTLKKDIEDLLQRQQAVESLQNERNRPVQLLEELVRQVPEGVYLTALKQDGDKFTISGVAQSNERVSDLLRNLGSVPWLDHAELGESVATTMTNNLKEQRRLFNFTVRFQWKAEPATPAKPGAAGVGAGK